ncbi:50S ribosomal protein L3p (L3e) [Chitinispirillum alkaliphilum]|nr:50S ribosomal protein L3p (L3e) [Chitinispirillum alkaliphilum]
MIGLIGRKVGMTRIFDESGKSVPVTVIQTGNNIVHQVKTNEKDGYVAVQLGFGEVSTKKLTKPMEGHFKKHNSTPTKVIREFKLDNEAEELQPGQAVGVEAFENIKYVDVEGVSKGRGHAGTIKRYNFQRGRETHGNTNVRERGSSGAGTYPARVFPGLKMSGHMGAESVTVKRLELVGVDKDAGLMFVKGAVPGRNKGVVYIYKNYYKQQQ